MRERLRGGVLGSDVLTNLALGKNYLARVNDHTGTLLLLLHLRPGPRW